MRLINADLLGLTDMEIIMCNGDYKKALKMLIDKIEHAPTIDLAEPHWTLCSEKLPKVGQSVLMSVGGMYTAEGDLREDGNWSQYRWDAVQRKDMVEAWMPLPKAWSGK